MFGLDILKVLCNEGIDVWIIVLIVLDVCSDVYVMIDVGVDGYLFKDSEFEILLENICLVLKGENVFSDVVI